MKKKCVICGNLDLQKIISTEMMFGTGIDYNYNYCNICDSIQYNDKLGVQKDYPENYYAFRETKITLYEKFRFSLYCYSVKGVLNKLFFLNNFAANLFDEKSAYAVKGIIEVSNSILDIGCGNGDLIRAFSKIFKNKYFVGVDPFIAKSFNISVNCQIIKQDILDHDNLYDLILLNHSFEHMDNPHEVLNKLKELLNPGGVICMRIPVCDSLFFKKYGINWAQFDAPRHKIIYSNKALNIILNNLGFRIFQSYSDSKLFSYIASEMYKNNISLIDNRSYYKNRIRQFFRMSYYENCNVGKSLIKRLNSMNFGDQRVYVIMNDNSKF